MQPKVLNIKNDVYNYESISEMLLTQQIEAKLNNEQKVFLTFNSMPSEGIAPFLKQFKSNPSMDMIRIVFILDTNAPECEPNESYYQPIFERDLFLTILKNGQFGTYTNMSYNLLDVKGPVILPAAELKR